MGRLDRRGRDPHPGDLRNIPTADVANKTIVPFYANGALRVRKEDISLNRAYQRFGIRTNMQQFINRYMNQGGVSRLFGRNPKITSGQLPNIPPGLIEAIEAVFERFTDPLTQIEQEAIFRFVFMNFFAGNWDKVAEFFCFSLSGANADIGWKSVTGFGIASSIDGGYYVDNSNTFNTNFDPVIAGIKDEDAFIGFHVGKQAISTTGPGGILIGSPSLKFEGGPNGPGSLNYQIAYQFKSVSNSFLERYSSFYAKREDDLIDFMTNGSSDGSGLTQPINASIASAIAEVRATANSGNIYILSSTWGAAKGFNFQTWHDESEILFTALGAYSASVAANTTFNSVIEAGGFPGKIAITGPGDLSGFAIGDIVKIRSSDLVYNNVRGVVLDIGTGMAIDIPYTSNAGGGEVIEMLQPTP